MGRTAMSSREMRRAGILARVKSGELKLVNAAATANLKAVDSIDDYGYNKGHLRDPNR